jgi:hypothetical protein
MPPQKRAAARGRRNPDLLDQDQQVEQALGSPEGDEEDQPDFDSNDVQLLFEGDHVRVSVSIPVTLAEMDRYSIVQAEAQAFVRDGESGIDTAGRALDAMRYSFATTIESMEDDLRAYEEAQAAAAARVDRQVRTGR